MRYITSKFYPIGQIITFYNQAYVIKVRESFSNDLFIYQIDEVQS